jgi:hypothetical protein
MRAALILAFLSLPSLAEPVLADTVMTADAFEAYATGKTLTYAYGDQVFGAEQYLPGRQVLWAFKGEECRKGRWYEDAGEICFVYEDDGAPQCWVFYQDASGLRALFTGDPEGSELSEVEQSPEPLICAGPDVGV